MYLWVTYIFQNIGVALKVMMPILLHCYMMAEMDVIDIGIEVEPSYL